MTIAIPDFTYVFGKTMMCCRQSTTIASADHAKLVNVIAFEHAISYACASLVARNDLLTHLVF